MIHPSAICEAGSQIGEGTRVWHFCHVMTGARIGRDCVLGQGCFVAGKARLGDAVRLQNHVSVFDGVELDDFVFCGPGVTFTNVRTPRSEYPRRDEFEMTWVKRGASIGANATIRCGIVIGQYALIGAGSVVVSDVPAFALVVGNPSQQTGWVGRGGQRLHFDEKGYAACPNSGYRYVLMGDSVSEITAERV
jgi:UDP-2-acetamido-3-amino-2,3-dideoxy-glucuronate N-acetyltransferase